MRSRMWAIWPWAAVSVPLTVLVLFMSKGGWLGVGVLFTAIVWVPVAVGLALVPYFVLRHKHYHGCMPFGITVAMLVHWVTLLLFPLVVSDTNDNREIPAPMASVVGRDTVEVLDDVVALTVVASLLAALAWSALVPSQRTRPQPGVGTN